MKDAVPLINIPQLYYNIVDYMTHFTVCGASVVFFVCVCVLFSP